MRGVLTGHASGVQRVAISCEEARAICRSEDREVLPYNWISGSRTWGAHGCHRGGAGSVAIRVKGRREIFVAVNDRVMFWDEDTALHVRMAMNGGGTLTASVAVCANRRVAVSGRFDGRVVI